MYISNTIITQIKFVNEVYSDSVDIPKLIAQERCVALSHRTIENHLDEDRIHFRFVIKRKDEKVSNTKGSAKGLTTDMPAGPVKKLENPFVFKNKGQMKPNNARKPTSFQGGGGGGGLNISAEKSKAANAQPTPGIAQPVEFSSFNRNSEPNRMSPCYSASILKDDCFDLEVRCWFLICLEVLSMRNCIYFILSHHVANTVAITQHHVLIYYHFNRTRHATNVYIEINILDRVSPSH